MSALTLLLLPSTSLCLQAHPRRVVKVAKQIEREVGELLVHDKVGGTEQSSNSLRRIMTMSHVFMCKICPVLLLLEQAALGLLALPSWLSRC